MAKKETSNQDSLQKLKKDIREKTIGNLYVFFGEETFLKNHYLEQIRRHRTDEITESFNYRKLTGENFTMQDLIEGVEAMPMMAEYTLTVVDDVDIWKLNEDDRTRLGELRHNVGALAHHLGRQTFFLQGDLCGSHAGIHTVRGRNLHTAHLALAVGGLDAEVRQHIVDDGADEEATSTAISGSSAGATPTKEAM